MSKTKKEVLSWNVIGNVTEDTINRNRIKFTTDNIYIPNIQAKDIFINKANGTNLPLKNDKGEFKSKRFISTMDYSIEQVKLREVFQDIYGKSKKLITPLYNSKNEIVKIFSDSVMNLNFDYSCKMWNKINLYDEKGKKYVAYVKYGEFITLDQFDDCLAYKDDKLIGVIIDVKAKELKEIFAPFNVDTVKNTYDIGNSYNYNQYVIFGDEELDLTGENMRTILYNKGFDYNGVHYIRYKRANGAARQGKVLFIDEKLYPQMREYELLGLKMDDTETLDLAGMEAYISLTLSGCDTKEVIRINKDEILFVPDLYSTFRTECIAVSEENGSLQADYKDVEINNNLIDGEALIEADLLHGYGMSLCRERWFKACGFATRIQKFFSDNKITDVSQLNGFTLATDISQIKLIINSSCIKMLKFDTSEDAVVNWLKSIECNFYVVKHEHKTKFFDNKMVQSHYQLLNTLQLSETQTAELLQKDFDYMDLFNTDVNVFKYHVQAKYKDYDEEVDKLTLLELLSISEKAFYSELSKGVRDKLRESYRKKLLQGNSLIKGNYSVLFGNPLHYLYHSIGKQNEAVEMSGAECMTINPNFNYNDNVVLCRSPHVFCGNLALVKNVYIKEIDDYFALTDNIICVNAVNENIMERLSSCDYDSDTAIITNEKIVVDAVIKNYDKFGVPTSLVKPKGKNQYYYTMTDLAKLDDSIAKQSDTIGDIINTSQLFQSVMWDKINSGIEFDNYLIQDLIKDCALLDVMSCICIDSAKKDYSNIELNKELIRLKAKYKEFITNKEGNTVKPIFFKKIEELKKYDKPDNRYYSYKTTMCYVYELIKKFRTKSINPQEYYTLAQILQINIPCNKDKIVKNQIINILTKADELQKNVSSICTNKHDGWYGDYLKQTNAFYTYVNELTINIFTAYKLIRMLDINDPKITDIKKYITVAILSNPKITNMFLANMNTQDYYELEEVTGDAEIYDYKLYGIKFKKFLKNPLFQIEIA